MKILVVGGGGREHAIVDAISRSPQVEKIYCAPGNAGIALQAECVNIKDIDVIALKEFALSQQVDLTVVGPEASLAVGIVDEFRKAGLTIFGHTKAATQIESSKEFAKKLMDKYNVPTASYQTFTDFNEALDYVRKQQSPSPDGKNEVGLVLKYDGLAAGKGVVIPETLEEAESTLRSMLLDEQFGQGKVVVEECLTGPEFSFMCFVKGNEILPMPLSQDHKRAFDGDLGPNTGGMGAYTHLPFITDEDIKYAADYILQPIADAMVNEGMPLTGVLYGGLMKTPKGIKVIEFNARFGDPETEVVLPLLNTDIVDIFLWVAKNKQILSLTEVKEQLWSDDTTMGVVLASKGYPGSYAKGHEITLAENLSDANCQISVYHMGTAQIDNKIVTNGGRVMMIVGKGSDLKVVKEKVYNSIEQIKCDNLFFRHDIAYQALQS